MTLTGDEEEFVSSIIVYIPLNQHIGDDAGPINKRCPCISFLLVYEESTPRRGKSPECGTSLQHVLVYFWVCRLPQFGRLLFFYTQLTIIYSDSAYAMCDTNSWKLKQEFSIYHISLHILYMF